MTMPVGTIGAADLAAMGNDPAGADMEMILYSAEIQESSSRVKDTMDQIKLGSTLRGAISRRLTALRQLKAYAQAHTDTDGNLKDGFKEWLMEQTGGGDDYEAMVKLMDEGRNYQARIDPRTGAVMEKQGGSGETALIDRDLKTDNQPIHAEITRLEDEVSQIDSDRQMTMVRLNQEVNNKNRMTTLLTNLLRAKNQGSQGILNNLRV